MIQFKDVHKTYKTGVDALKGISFEIGDGEFVFIIGKSGSGKSTLMKCITCEERPTEGEVLIDGFNISDMSRALVPVLRRQIGMIYQDFRLIETKTVFENIAFAGEIIGIPKKSLAQTVQLVLNIVGLKDKADAYPQELSGGEQQRVAIARAMVNNPKLIVADEPTGNLDPETSENIMAILQEINRSGSTVVVCTHDSNLVDRMQKRVIEIDSGLIARDEEDSKYSDSFDDDCYAGKQQAPAFFFGETPPEVIAAQKAAEAKAAEEAAKAAKAAAALAAAKALEEADMPEEIPMLDGDDELCSSEEDQAAPESFLQDDMPEDDPVAESDDEAEDESGISESSDISDESSTEEDEEDDEIADNEDLTSETAENDKSDIEEQAEEPTEDPDYKEATASEEDWIEEISLSDIDLDIQEDDD